MRNHGFIYTGAEGWTLSPAYGLNPVPIDVSRACTAIDDEEQNASLELAFSVAEYFKLDAREAPCELPSSATVL